MKGTGVLRRLRRLFASNDNANATGHRILVRCLLLIFAFAAGCAWMATLERIHG